MGIEIVTKHLLDRVEAGVAVLALDCREPRKHSGVTAINEQCVRDETPIRQKRGTACISSFITPSLPTRWPQNGRMSTGPLMVHTTSLWR